MEELQMIRRDLLPAEEGDGVKASAQKEKEKEKEKAKEEEQEKASGRNKKGEDECQGIVVDLTEEEDPPKEAKRARSSKQMPRSKPARRRPSAAPRWAMRKDSIAEA